jgi:hypothetical protein
MRGSEVRVLRFGCEYPFLFSDMNGILDEAK